MADEKKLSTLEKEYKSFDIYEKLKFSRVGCILAMILVPAGVFLDYFIYQESLTKFFVLRSIVVALCIIIYYLHFINSAKRFSSIISLSWPMIIQIMICYMIYETDGFQSTYYAGLNLPILALGVLLPLLGIEVFIFATTTISLYVIACIYHPNGLSDTPLLINNIFFLIATSIISITAVNFRSKKRYSEFELKYQLNKKNQQLSEVDKLKSQFFANISHELRTPLTLILAPIQDLINNNGVIQQKSALNLIQNNARRLLKLVNDLLDVIKLEEGKFEINFKPIEINSIVKNTAKSMEFIAKKKSITLYKSISSEPIYINADISALEKILYNVIGNAIKFTEPDGLIEIHTEYQTNVANIVIKDNGIGISESEQTTVFERFKQADGSDTRKYQGTGLGLALVNELMQEMEGKISLTSVKGIGTSIKLQFKIITNIDGTSNKTSQVEYENTYDKLQKSVLLETHHPSFPNTSINNGKMGTAFIVDDEPDILHYLKSTLQNDYQVYTATNGKEALINIAKIRPDLVLTDLMLPELNGLELCKKLKNDPNLNQIKIILLTARIDEKSKIMALENGADDFITKPFSSIEIKTRLDNLFRTSRLQRKLSKKNEELQSALNNLKETERQLFQSEKLNAIGNLAAGLLHEVNNPLNYVITALEIARINTEGNDELDEIYDDIDEGLSRIKTIVSDLRTFAYPSTSEYQRTFSLKATIKDSLNFTAHECKNVDITICDIPDSYVIGSQSHITQVLINLISNAKKAIGKDALNKGNILISTQINNGRIYISVKDNGHGISKDDQRKIFDPFFTTADIGEGMGLGLSICHRIISNHQGQLIVESEAGNGATFTFDLCIDNKADLKALEHQSMSVEQE